MNCKQFGGLFLAACLVVTLPLQALARPAKVMEGTEVELKLVEAISSETHQEGDVVNFEVSNDILGEDGKTVVIKAGASAVGTVAEAEKRKMLGKKGEIRVVVDYTKAIDGTRVPLRANLNRAGESKATSTVALSVIVTPLFLLKKGQEAKLGYGTKVHAFVDKDITVNVK